MAKTHDKDGLILATRVPGGFFYKHQVKTITEFRELLKAEIPPAGISPQLKSLWYDGKGDWHSAHAEVDHLTDQASQWVHAYLHRKEGDIWNADYWYNRARRKRPNFPLEKEWEQLVLQFLNV